eukprot:356062-Prymnesium_polylepis.1
MSTVFFFGEPASARSKASMKTLKLPASRICTTLAVSQRLQCARGPSPRGAGPCASLKRSC